MSGRSDLDFKIAREQIGLETQQGPGPLGPWDYVEVFGFLQGAVGNHSKVGTQACVCFRKIRWLPYGVEAGRWQYMRKKAECKESWPSTFCPPSKSLLSYRPEKSHWRTRWRCCGW